MSQEGWPFENKVRGVAVRFEFGGPEDCACDPRIGEPHEEDCQAAEDPDYPDGTSASRCRRSQVKA